MNKKELEKLKEQIEDMIDKLNSLQGVHRRETGKNFSPPARLAPRKKTEPESCASCKWRTGSRCKKNKEYVSMGDWCFAYSRKTGG